MEAGEIGSINLCKFQLVFSVLLLVYLVKHLSARVRPHSLDLNKQ